MYPRKAPTETAIMTQPLYVIKTSLELSVWRQIGFDNERCDLHEHKGVEVLNSVKDALQDV